MKKTLKIILFVFLFFVVLIIIIPSDDEQSKTEVNEQVRSVEVPTSSASQIVEVDTANQQQPETRPIGTNEQVQQNTQVLYSVARVIDGDTFEVEIDDVKERVRLIGVDTPETVDPRKPVECFGIEASNKMKSLVEGKQVGLESDPSQGDRGKYGRLLRYVFLPDGTHINDAMIREGYAYEYTYQIPYKYQTQFKQAEQEARDNKRGLWADGVCDDEAVPVQNETPPPPIPTTQPKSSQPTQSEPTPTSSICDCSGDLYNCSGFKTHGEAQAVFECCMAQVGKDIHKLDANNDGQACESLP